MPNRVLIDSSFLYATYDADDRYHDEAEAFAEVVASILLVPQVALTEAAFLFSRAGGVTAVVRFLAAFSENPFQLEPILMADLRRAREIMAAYSDARLDFVDCCIMALAERLNITQVCTFDRRDFEIFRPQHCEYLELLP